MLPSAYGPPAAAAPAPQPAPQPAPSTPSLGSGGGAQGGGPNPPASPTPQPALVPAPATPALQPGQLPSLSDRLNADLAAAEAAAAAGNQVPGAALPGAAPAPRPTETPEVQQLRAQAAAGQQAMARVQQMEAAISTMQQWAAYGNQVYQAQRAGQPVPAMPGVQPAAAAQPTTPAQPASITGVPQFDPALLALIGTDEKGNLTAAPGAPPDLLVQYQNYQRASQQFFRKFAQDPMQVLGDPIRNLVQQEAQKIVQAQHEQRQSHEFSQQYLVKQSAVLFAKDAQGNEIRDFQGNRTLSPVGQLFYNTVLTLDQQGVKDPRVQAQLAERIVAGHIYQMQQTQQPAAAQQVPAQQVQPVAQVAPQPQYQAPQAPQGYVQPQQQAPYPYQQPQAQPQPQYQQPAQVNPLAALAEQMRGGFLGQQQQVAAAQYPAPAAGVTPQPQIARGPGGRPLGLQEQLRLNAAQFGINMDAP